MSYIDVLILRYLTRGPAHGYQMRKHVEASTGFVLHNNSLYPALRRFEEAGAVTKTAQPQEGRPARHVYRITAVGVELLLEMLADLPADQAGEEAEFLSRLAQFELLTPPERLAVLDARDAALRALLDHLRAMSERAHGDQWASLITGELISRGEAERTWLAGLRALAASAPVTAATPPAEPEAGQ